MRQPAPVKKPEMSTKLIDVENQAGEVIPAGEHKLIPIAQRVKIQPPGFGGLLLWTRPTAVVVHSVEGEKVVLPIQDVTRLAQLALVSLGLISSTLIWLGLRKKIRN
jgi:hypothetical protein